MSGEDGVRALRGSRARRLIALSALAVVAVVAILLAVAVSAAAFRLLSAGTAPEPSVPSGNGVLVSAVHDDGIVTWTLGDERARVIVPRPAAPTEWYALPRFSPDGTKLAFLRIANGSSGASIMVANADGTDLRALIDAEPGIRGFDWAPSSREIAYTADKDEGWAVFVVGIGPGERSRPIAQVDGQIAFLSSVLWHPAGEQLIVLKPSGGVFTVGRGGGAVTELVGGVVSDVGDMDASPDGRVLALTKSGRVHFMDLVTRVTERRDTFERSVQFSPDGRWLATTRKIDGGTRVFIRPPHATSDEAVGIGPVIEEDLWSQFSPDATTMIVGPVSDYSQAWRIDLASRAFEPIAWPGEPPVDWQPLRP
jgi:dipeptidyl aminopeptidase/acylaminoacyl peptidase